MNMPGFTAELATQKSWHFYAMLSLSNRGSSHASPAALSGKCGRGTETSGCPSGYWCSEPGFYPHCHCLECTPTRFGIGTTVSGNTQIILPGAE